MVRLAISALLILAANAVGLLVAALVLDQMSLSTEAFFVATAIFTVVEVVAGPLIRQIAIKNVRALVGSVALITTFVGLVVTDIFADGLSISGVWTWVLATIIVWLASLLAGLILPALFLKEAVDRSRGKQAPTETVW